jgi:uncharacterized protein
MVMRRIRPFSSVFLALLSGYKLLISPLFGTACRYQPSCSDYAAEAIRRYGVFKGGLMAGKRLLRCHPWGGSGVDEVR